MCSIPWDTILKCCCINTFNIYHNKSFLWQLLFSSCIKNNRQECLTARKWLETVCHSQTHKRRFRKELVKHKKTLIFYPPVEITFVGLVHPIWRLLRHLELTLWIYRETVILMASMICLIIRIIILFRKTNRERICNVCNRSYWIGCWWTELDYII